MAISFRERLTPSVAVMVIAAVFGAMLGVILWPLSDALAIGAALVLMVAMPAFAWVTSPIIMVTSSEVVAGRAHIEPEFIGEVRELSREDLRAVLGPDIRPWDYRMIRGWIPTGVMFEVIDERDPAEHWVLSVRHASACAEAIRALKGA